jgi:hypothetical protein
MQAYCNIPHSRRFGETFQLSATESMHYHGFCAIQLKARLDFVIHWSSLKSQCVSEFKVTLSS